MLRRISALSAVVLGWAFVFSGTTARGDTIVVTNLTQNTVTGVYTYGVQVTSTAVVDPGDGFVIYDLAGVTNASQVSFTWTSPVPAGDTFSPSFSTLGNAIGNGTDGVTPGPSNLLDIKLNSVLHLTDDSSVDNLSMVFSGPELAVPNVPATGILTVTSTVNGPNAILVNLGVLSADSGGGLYAFSMLSGPGFGGGGSVPLPASFMGGGLLMIGLAGAGMMKKLRSQPIVEM
jgi:hypothetical protein